MNTKLSKETIYFMNEHTLSGGNDQNHTVAAAYAIAELISVETPIADASASIKRSVNAINEIIIVDHASIIVLALSFLRWRKAIASPTRAWSPPNSKSPIGAALGLDEFVGSDIVMSMGNSNVPRLINNYRGLIHDLHK